MQMYSSQVVSSNACTPQQQMAWTPHQLAGLWQQQQKAYLSLQQQNNYAPQGQHEPCTTYHQQKACTSVQHPLECRPAMADSMFTLAADHERRT